MTLRARDMCRNRRSWHTLSPARSLRISHTIAEDETTAKAAVDYCVEGGGLRWGEVGYETTPDLTIDPARVLAECEAKRRIVQTRPFKLLESGNERQADRLRDQTVRALAVVYADHPDYRSEWAP